MSRRPEPKPADDARLVVRQRARKRDADRLERGLIDHNDAVAPHDMPYRDFTVLAHDAKGRLLGGMYGKMYWDWLFIEKMWVDRKARQKGLGLRIMAAGEAHAREFGCHSAWLDTMSFQARPFYEKQGYRVFGQLDDYPIGATRYFMTKKFTPVSSAQRLVAKDKAKATAPMTRAKPGPSKGPSPH